MANQNNKKARVPELVKQDAAAASILSKLTRDNTNKSPNSEMLNLPDIASANYDRIQNNEDVVQLFPDVELCIQILTSCVISPNDMLSNKLTYIPPELKLPMELKRSLLEKIEEYIEKTYKINSNMSTILRESLFTKGAYIEAIIPEASLDDIISDYKSGSGIGVGYGFEAYLNSKLTPTFNYLGQNNRVGLSFTNEANHIVSFGNLQETKNTLVFSEEELCISITDNPKVLSMRDAMLKNIEKRTARKRITKEDANYDRLDNFFRDGTKYQYKHFIQVKTKDDASRRSIGSPLVMKLPVECVLPVHATNDASKHIGYFVLLDQSGSPLDPTQYLGQDEEYNWDQSNVESGTRFALTRKAKEAILGITKKDVRLNQLENIYSDLVESMIKKKLETGAYGDLVDIKKNADIFKVMFLRALRAKQTKLLFLPKELVQFYAFEYRDNGTGKSLMEKVTVLYSLRAIMLFSRLMAYIKNSTNRTTVNATLDDDEPDPEGRMEQIISETLKLRQSQFPLGIVKLNDLTTWAQHLGINYKIQGGGLPNMDISIEDGAPSKTIPDEELDRSIKEYIFMAFGLTPEVVESGYSSEFATTVVAKNLLLAKRVTRLQEQFTVMLTEHIQKLIINDNYLLDELKKIIDNNKSKLRKALKGNKEQQNIDNIKDNEIVDYVLETYVNEITVELPQPEMFQAQSAKEAFDSYRASIDETADVVFSTEALVDEYFGAMSGKVDTIKAIFKASLLLKYITKNNYIPELTDFLTKDDDGNPVFNALDDYKSFATSLGESFIPFIKSSLKDKVKLDEKIQKAEDAANYTGGSDYDSGGESDYSSDDQGTDEGGEEGATGDDNMDDNPDDTGDTDSGDDTGGDDGGFPSLDDEGEGGGEGEGDEGGDEGGLDDFDMDMGDEEGGDEGSGDNDSSKKTYRSPEEIALNERLLDARIKKEEALAEKAKANAVEAKQKAGLDPNEPLGEPNEEESDNLDGGEGQGEDEETEGENPEDQGQEPTGENDQEVDTKEGSLVNRKLKYDPSVSVFNNW